MSNIDPSQEGDLQVDIKEYRQAMDRLAAAEKLAADREKALQVKDVEVAVQIAGIPTGTGAGKAFVAGYTGALEPDAIKAAAIEFGIFTPEGSDPTGTPAAQAQVEADRAALQQGLPPDMGQQAPTKSPGEEGKDAFDAALASGRSRINASCEIINRITDAAIRGDESVLVRPWTEADFAG